MKVKLRYSKNKNLHTYVQVQDKGLVTYIDCNEILRGKVYLSYNSSYITTKEDIIKAEKLLKNHIETDEFREKAINVISGIILKREREELRDINSGKIEEYIKSNADFLIKYKCSFRLNYEAEVVIYNEDENSIDIIAAFVNNEIKIPSWVSRFTFLLDVYEELSFIESVFKNAIIVKDVVIDDLAEKVININDIVIYIREQDDSGGALSLSFGNLV